MSHRLATALCLAALLLAPALLQAFDRTDDGFSDVRIPLKIDGTGYVLLLAYADGDPAPTPSGMVLVRQGAAGIERVEPSDPAYAKAFAVFAAMGEAFSAAAKARASEAGEAAPSILGQQLDEDESAPSMDGLEGGEAAGAADAPARLPDGEPIRFGSREIAAAHFVKQSQSDPSMRAVVLFIRSSSRPSNLQSSSLQMTMRSIAIKPDMYLTSGNHQVSGSVQTLKFEMKPMEDQEGMWMLKGIYKLLD